jgi:thioredoxin 1
MLVDLGRGTCIPCKKMKPILDELTIKYQGKAIVKVIDLRDEPQAAREYGIRLIPTQIFFDADGKEVYRHEGFMDKQSIKAKFAEMGVY